MGQLNEYEQNKRKNQKNFDKSAKRKHEKMFDMVKMKFIPKF